MSRHWVYAGKEHSHRTVIEQLIWFKNAENIGLQNRFKQQEEMSPGEHESFAKSSGKRKTSRKSILSKATASK